MMNRLLELCMHRRGYTNEWLQEINIHPHQTLKDTDKFVTMLHNLKRENKHIVVLSDFDTDGITSAIISYAGLAELGFRVSLFRPTVSDGYGFSSDTIHRLKQEFPDADAIITSDVGISCYDGVATAKEYGMTVLVTDHHIQVDNGLVLDADCIVNPNRLDDTYFNKGICGAHVLWQSLYAYACTYETVFLQEQIRRLLVFAGIGTVSDAMPILYENRPLVEDACSICRLIYNNGSDYLVSNIRGCTTYRLAFYGLYYLLSEFFMRGKLRTEKDIDEKFFGYYFAPLFNSAKRMNADMNRVFGIFFGFSQIDDINYLFDLNEQRKIAVDEAYQALFSIDQPYAPYIYFSDANGGILGLLAMKLLKANGVPSLVLGEHNGVYKGSGRSLSVFDIRSAMESNGFRPEGHASAFGILVNKSDIQLLYQVIDTVVTTTLHTSDVVTTPNYDILISTEFSDGVDSDIDIPLFADFVSSCNRLKPFGKGFEQPVVGFLFRPNDGRWQRMGERGAHLKITFDYGFSAFFINMGDYMDDFMKKDKLLAIGTLSTFGEHRSIQFSGELMEGVV